jgi:hypothetical protein
MIESMEALSGIGRSGPHPAVAARRARQRNRVLRAVEESSGWPEFVPQVGAAEGPLGEVQEAEREIARWTAVRSRKLTEYAETRPASADRAQGEPGAMSAERYAARPEILKQASEWTAQEVSVALTCTQTRADRLLTESLRSARLPGTLAAMESGMFTVGHLLTMLEHVEPIEDAELRAEVEAEILRWVAARVAERMITTPPQLADRARRVVLRRGARDRAKKALTALRDRGIYPQSERGEGLAALALVGTKAEIAALRTALEAYAAAVEDDPGTPVRTRAQKMLDCIADLVLRPGDGTHEPVRVDLTLVAPLVTALGGDLPAELNGDVISAETARQLLRLLTGAAVGNGALAEYAAAAGSATGSATAAAAPGISTTAADGRFVDEPGLQDWEMAPDMLAALREWEADWERRLRAGEFDDPEPMTESELLASAERSAVDLDPEFDRALIDAQERWQAEFAAGRMHDPLDDDVLGGDPPDHRHPDEPDPPLPDNGWWIDADRAVTDAQHAVEGAERALDQARRMVRTAQRSDRADEASWRTGPGGRVDRARDALEALAAATVADRAALGHLLNRTAGGGLADRPRIALVDALTGALVSLTDLAGLRRAAHCDRPACRRRPERCEHDLSGRPGLGAPGPTDGYRPGAALDRFVRARDRRCRFPGCRRRVPARGELDHHVRYPLGPTAAANLAGYCTIDHRAKHQAPGFVHHLDAEGTLTVTTPSGITVLSDPPPY